jgi:glycosyltransferase involved in cell wall biosynthesis
MTALPFLSVIMPIRNEGAIIRESLEAVLAQDYDQDRMEILVVDGMSTDDTRQIVLSMQSRSPNIILLDNPGKIVPVGMNIALRRARGDIFVRVDGHCTIARDYVSRCVGHLQNDGVDGVGGPVHTVGSTRVARVIALAMSSKFGVGGSAFRTVTDRTMLADTVPFPAYTRAIVQRAGPYDEELVRNQDDEYNYRLRKLGAKLLLASDVRSEYFSRSSLRSLWRQYYQYGYWKVRVLQKHPMQMSARQFVPAALVASLCAAAALCIPAPAAGLFTLGAILIAYMATNILASLLTARGADRDVLILLPTAYAALHFSYGLGFLRGLVKFRNRWGDQPAAQW